jgi:hypothetical protein
MRGSRDKVATHLAILLVAGHLLAPHGAALDRAGLIATARAHNWYCATAESRLVTGWRCES